MLRLFVLLMKKMIRVLTLMVLIYNKIYFTGAEFRNQRCEDTE